MLFQTLIFLAFLSVALVLYWQASGTGRLVLLALANALFYLAAGWGNLLLFLTASAVTYGIGQVVTGPRGKVWLGLGVALNVANLAWFKYAGFLATSLHEVLPVPWLSPELVAGVLLPIGISFYSFQHISYLVDRRLRGLPPASSYLHFWVYIAFFGHSIAGPIMRGHEFFPQIDDAPAFRFDVGRLHVGLAYFTIGLVKKVGIATPLAAWVDPLFASPSALTGGEAWTAALLFAFQIYYDFSAYSDMAVGIGHMFGFTLTQNFHTPYVATNASDFWRRWHVTLSAWIRDYVYVPLGGNRHGPARRDLNLVVAMLASGLWHGANWTFLAWGGYHAGLLLAQRGWDRAKAALGWAFFDGRVYACLAPPAFFLLVVVGWLPFRCTAVDDALLMALRMVDPAQVGSYWSVKKGFALAGGLYALHWIEAVARRDEAAVASAFALRVPVFVQGGLLASLVLGMMLVNDGAKEFIYFRF